jgi:hypothetical protein
MGDPKRILDDPTSSPIGAALLADALDAGPTASEVDATWASLTLRLAAPGEATASKGDLAASRSGRRLSSVTTAAAKTVALLVVASTIAIGAPWMHRHVDSLPAKGSARASAAHAATSAIEQPDPSAPVATETSGESVSAPAAALAPRAPRPKPAAVPDTSAAPLRVETTLVLRARQAIRAGDCDVATGMLKEGDRRFVPGILAEERETLTVEALACAGRGAEAAERAQAFLRAHPASAHGAGVRRFIP